VTDSYINKINNGLVQQDSRAAGKIIMIICPWCGTNYLTFQSNCDKCGGPLQLVEEKIVSPDVDEILQYPPLPPRPISDRYVWRLFLGDGWWITILILGMLGFVFFQVGAGLIIGVITAFVGIPFLLLGIGFLIAVGWVAVWRYQIAQKVVNVLRVGEAARGQITEVLQDYSVSINERNPWVIRYQFRANGQNFEGKITTFNPLGQHLQTGKAVSVLYLPADPKWSSIYPHP
jgi:hypothetical protein